MRLLGKTRMTKRKIAMQTRDEDELMEAQPLIVHLMALRKVIIICLAAVVIFFLIVFFVSAAVLCNLCLTRWRDRGYR